MKHISRDTLIKALVNAYPDRPRVFFDVLSDTDLRVEFQQIANEHAMVLSQYRSVEYAR